MSATEAFVATLAEIVLAQAGMWPPSNLDPLRYRGDDFDSDLRYRIARWRPRSICEVGIRPRLGASKAELRHSPVIRHANRTTVNADDVKLLARRNPALVRMPALAYEGGSFPCADKLSFPDGNTF
jgi:CENP-S protein